MDRAGLGHAGLRPGQIGGALLGLWEVTGGCVVAKDRTHSRAYTWKLGNTGRYKSVSLNAGAGTAGRGEPAEPGLPLSSCLSSQVSVLSPSLLL